MIVPDLRHLADSWALQPAYLSLFLDLRRGIDESFLRKRQKECEAALSGHRDQLAAFRDALARSEGMLRSKQWGCEGLALFAGPAGFLEAYEMPGETENRMVFDSSPFIKPLVGVGHEWEEYIVVVLDHTHARLFMVSHYDILQKDTVAEEIVRKHRKGGMSQLRFQRLHDGYVGHYFKEVVEHLEAEVERCRAAGHLRGIVLEGPKDAKVQLEAYLPVELRKLVAGELAEPVDAPDSEVVRRADGVFRAAEAGREQELMDKLRSGILGHGLATYGYGEVRQATEQGRADTLLVQKGLALKGWRCERCRAFDAGEPGEQLRCPVCGGMPLEVDAVEELMELAMDKDTKVEFVAPDLGLRALGGLGALLRY